jgi:ATP-dependent Clp protease adaptor protein ClpS
MSEIRGNTPLDVVVEHSKPRLQPPPMYKVVMINDDYTPMEFVVQVLQSFFSLAREKAVQVMLQVHQSGRGVAGIYSAEIAETKVAQVNAFSRKHQHPLLTVMEKA